ncbi:hypothetical protein QFZ81_000995 [Paenibacillus sp. V4I9]|uniref:hypothetical protein n=1 Tax=Paenibacillus sp. V4I9 TaxID=3042308 RepID=UPI002781EC90|nr:hypothetical protein [Paenibacillus sp. V4I9]MDQ0885907.1 hypothetical protein [Paenibacillus sp. V4I9]
MTTQTITQSLLSKEQQKNVHLPAFLEISKVIRNFISKSASYQTEGEHHYVCSSNPGHGKTTALEAVVKQEIVEKYKTPLLLAFNNNDNMRTFYDSLVDYANKQNGYNAIQFINTDNVDEYVDDKLSEYQVLCITHQRLRDLALDIGNQFEYMWYKSPSGKQMKRCIIIDEAPIFVSSCTFDINSKDNHIDWYDESTKVSELDVAEIMTGRKVITNMINLELNENSTITKRLNRFYEGTSDLEALNNILSKLKPDHTERDVQAKFSWFKKLLNEDDVASIDRHHFGSSIICAKRIDYRSLGNILILDGSSNITRSMYNNEYQYIQTKNYHDYRKRLKLHLQEINSSSYAKSDKVKYNQLFQNIANDIESIRSLGINPFPIMMKSEIATCIELRIIQPEFLKYYEVDKNISDELPLNLLNTTGKNVLNTNTSLALLSIPIKHPSVYKKAAISLYGNDIDLTMNKGKSKVWFVDERVQNVFEELVLADLIQIIHRSSLRNINEDSEVNIYLYTNRTVWIEKLKSALNLADENITSSKLEDLPLEKFVKKCEEWAVKAKEYVLNYDDIFKIPKFTAYDIGGNKFKDWFNTYWNKVDRKQIIIDHFKQNGLGIEVDENGYKKIYILP